MIKTNFSVNNEEKDRILNLHESATKNQYLVMEESDATNFNIFPPTKEEISIGKDFVTKQLNNPKYQAWYRSVLDDKNYDEYRTLIEPLVKGLDMQSIASNKEYGRLGRYLKKNPQLNNAIEEYAAKNPKVK